MLTKEHRTRIAYSSSLLDNDGIVGLAHPKRGALFLRSFADRKKSSHSL